jgi:hypothetical protein
MSPVWHLAAKVVQREYTRACRGLTEEVERSVRWCPLDQQDPKEAGPGRRCADERLARAGLRGLQAVGVDPCCDEPVREDAGLYDLVLKGARRLWPLV